MKHYLARLLGRMPLVDGLARHAYAQLRAGDRMSLEARLEAVLGNRRRVFFVQIGSNDGRQGDPLHNMIKKNEEWSGVFVEPVKLYFDRLKENYGASAQFIFENIAVGESRGTKPFYYVSELAKQKLGSDLPPWADQLGSFRREHIIEHLGPGIDKFIIEENIECLELSQILSKNNIDAIDVIHIDAEGFDSKVIGQIDFSLYRPTIILFEHKHMSEVEMHDTISLLKHQGYSLHSYTNDTMAVRSFWHAIGRSLSRF